MERSKELLEKIREHKGTTLAVIAILMVLSLMAGITVGTPTHYVNAGAMNFGSNPVSTDINVSFAGVHWLPVRPGYFWNANDSFKGEKIAVDPKGSVINNSGYQILNFSSSTAALASIYPNPTGAQANPTRTNISIPVNVSKARMFYLDMRIAINGSLPAGALGFNLVMQAPGGGSDHNNTLAIYSVGSTKGAPMLGAAWSSAGVTPLAASGSLLEYISNLTFYDLIVEMNSSGFQVSVMNPNGTIVSTGIQSSNYLPANYTKIDFVNLSAFQMPSNSLVWDYGFMLNNTPVGNTTTAFDPFTAVGGGSTPPPTGKVSGNESSTNGSSVSSMSTSAYGSTTMSESAFAALSRSNTSSAQVASALNGSDILNVSRTPAVLRASPFLTTLRAQSGKSVQATANLVVTSWSPANVSAAEIAFLQSYIAANTGYNASSIFIVSYVVSNIAFDVHMTSQAATSFRTAMDKMMPGELQKDNLSLVNRSTGAVAAGVGIGEFYSAGAVYPANVQGHRVQNPVTGTWYASLAAAGFPSGSYITSSGSIIVPGQATFYGFTASGVPVFSPNFLGFGSALSGAAQAAGNFLGQAASSVTNGIGSASKAATDYVVKPIGTAATDFQNFSKDWTQTVSNTFPIMGGSIGNIAHSIGGIVTHSLGSVNAGLASARQEAAGAIASGYNGFSHDIYHIGSTLSAGAGAFGTGIMNTALKYVNDSSAVLSPYYTGAINFGTGIVNATKNAYESTQSYFTHLAASGSAAAKTLLNEGVGALNTAAVDVQGTISGGIAKFSNITGVALSQMNSLATSIMGAGGNILGAIGNGIHFLFGLPQTISKIIEYGAIAALGIFGVIALVWLVSRRNHSKAGKGKTRMRSADASSLVSPVPMLAVA